MWEDTRYMHLMTKWYRLHKDKTDMGGEVKFNQEEDSEKSKQSLVKQNIFVKS